MDYAYESYNDLGCCYAWGSSRSIVQTIALRVFPTNIDIKEYNKIFTHNNLKL